MPKTNVLLSSFNHYPQQTCTLHRPERYHELTPPNKPVIARGRGYSYGDAALNENGNVISTERLNRFLAFDRTKGIITAEAGVTLQEILNVIIPAGWFLPVTPGTQHATLGGCIAVDAHGKNHSKQSSFAQHIQWLDLITASGDTIRCSQIENKDLFLATLGGLGLTGIIGAASLKLMSITSSYLKVSYQATENIDQTLTLLKENNDEYNVAWIDVNYNSKNPGQGIIMSAQHADVIELPERLKQQPLAIAKQKLNIPCHHFSILLNNKTSYIFNKFYYVFNRRKRSPQYICYENYFYPLDHINNWNRIYGKKGFIQYQCTIPFEHATEAFNELMLCLKTAEQPVFLAVAKKFAASNAAPLSYASPGFTFAFDMPIQTQTFATLNKMDEVMIKYNGRVYLAKDARLSAQTFRIMYPRYAEWLAIKNKIDPENIFNSSLSRRLEIC